MTEDFYDLMDVDEDASQEDIKDAFREKVREYHPDLNDDPRAQAQFTALKKAYDTLGNPSERKSYDRMGHEDYVTKRIKGLPSQDKWADDTSSSDDAGTTGATTGSSSASSTTRGASSATGTTGSTSSRSSSSGRSRSSSGSSRSSGSRSASSSSSSGTSSSSSTGTSDRHSSGSRSTATGAATSSTSASGSASTSSSSSSTSTATGSATGTATGSYGGTSTTTAESDTGPEGLFGRLLRTKVGWPGIALADVVYAVGVALFVLANAASLRSFGDALATAETATIRSAATAEPAEPLRSYLYGTEYVAATEIAAPAAVLLVGAVLLPFVYGVVVKRTRRSQFGWDPSWLYVVLALGPLAGVAANVAGVAYVGVDVVCFLVAPLLTMLTLPLSAFVRPLIGKVFFEG